jgi:hypothetical protein
MTDSALKVAFFVINLVLASTVAFCWWLSWVIYHEASQTEFTTWLFYTFTVVVTVAFYRRVAK